MTTITITCHRRDSGHALRPVARLRRPHLPRPGIAQCAAVVLVASAGAAVLGWGISGGRLLVMDSPSMCPQVCVGSLVADRQLAGPIRVGELVTFHPPGSSTETFTHEVIYVFANGSVQTRGWANSEPDPWSTPRSRIVGVVAFSVRDLGWLFRAMPLTALAVLVWALGRSAVRSRRRRTWDTVWLAFLLSVPVWMLKPLVKGSVLSTLSDEAHKGWLVAKIVNTGLLPVSFMSGDSGGSYAAPGASVHVAGHGSASGHLSLYEAVHLPWWGWLIVGSVVLFPLARRSWRVPVGDDSLSPRVEPASPPRSDGVLA